MTDALTMSELARVQKERDSYDRMLRVILALVDDSTHASLGPDAPLRAVKALVADRNWQHKERLRLDVLRADLAAERDAARAEADVLRQEIRERERAAEVSARGAEVQLTAATRTVTEVNWQLVRAEQQLAAMTAARDEACDIAIKLVEQLEPVPGGDYGGAREAISTLRQAGSK